MMLMSVMAMLVRRLRCCVERWTEGKQGFGRDDRGRKIGGRDKKSE
jgi:hypothetical protein